jgi:RNA polymerase sigma factor (sigma-70 family)
MEEKPMQHDSPAQLAPLNREAFQSFYKENLGPIYRYVYGKVRNREEAEDLTSQVFIKAVRHIDHEQNPQSIRSWLFQVARTTIADYWRAYYRTATSSLDALLEAGWEGPIEHEDKNQPFEIHSSSADHVQHLLQTLPERDREVLTCRFLLGLSVRETAVRMGVTEGNVKTMQFRALKHAADLESVKITAGGGRHI